MHRGRQAHKPVCCEDPYRANIKSQRSISSSSGSSVFEKATPGLWLIRCGSARLVYMKAPGPRFVSRRWLLMQQQHSRVMLQKRERKKKEQIWGRRSSVWSRNVLILATPRACDISARAWLPPHPLCEHPAGLLLCCCCCCGSASLRIAALLFSFHFLFFPFHFYLLLLSLSLPLFGSSLLHCGASVYTRGRWWMLPPVWNGDVAAPLMVEAGPVTHWPRGNQRCPWSDLFFLLWKCVEVHRSLLYESVKSRFFRLWLSFHLHL